MMFVHAYEHLHCQVLISCLMKKKEEEKNLYNCITVSTVTTVTYVSILTSVTTANPVYTVLNISIT